MIAPSELTSLVAAHGLHPRGVVLRSLDGAGGVALDPEIPLYPASMIKTPLVAAALLEAESGRYGLDDPVAINAANLTENDAPSPLVPGYTATVRELCTRAIAYSDNVATNELYDLVGRERATSLVRRHLGLGATGFFRKLSGSEPRIADAGWDGMRLNTHPPCDAARLFEAIASDAIPYADLLRDMLAAQMWNEKLACGLHDGDRFAHKTGDTDEVCHDGGILTTASGSRYVIVVYTGLASSKANDARLASFMKALRASL